MRYQEASFTLPTNGDPNIDRVTYEVRVGLRCPICYAKFNDDEIYRRAGNGIAAGRLHECKATS